MRKRFPWGWIISVLLVLAGFVAWRIARTPRQTPSVAQTTPPPKNLTAWPLPEPPAKSLTPTNLPMVPQLPPAVRDGRIKGFRGWDPISLSLRVKALSLNHPHPDIREDFFRRVEAGEISLNFQTPNEVNMLFQVVPASEIDHRYTDAAPRSDYLALSINPDWMGQLQGDHHILTAMLVLYHEYQHFKEWRDGDEATRAKMRLRRDIKEQDKQGITQADACRDMWNEEFKAYAEQCRLANKWGFAYGGQLCRYVDSPIWPHAMFTVLGSTELYRQACLRTFADLAGHPYPEQFGVQK